MNNRLPLLEEVLKYHKEKNLLLSMPGNKGGVGFLKDDIGKEFVSTMGYLDITEVGNLDNFHNPEGVIKEAQELLANLYKSEKAYFLVNGSSSGNLASIFSAFNEGDEVLVERNCHKSIYNALILRKLKPVYIEANIDLHNGILLPCNEKNIEAALVKAKDPRGIILTSPNYYGISCDLEKILRKLKANGVKILIDAAHGAHYGINKRLPESMVRLAHYVVLSAHKTLPALTQGAYLLVNDIYSNVEFFISAFNTTSPSYLIMSSLDYARYYLENYGDEDYDLLIDLAEVYKNQINSLDKVIILSQDDIEGNYKLDKSRYIMTLPIGYSGNKLLEYLLENNIQSEMSFSRGVVLILSPFNTREDFEKIYQAIMFLDIETLKDEDKNVGYIKLDNIKRLEPFEVHNARFEEVEINNAVGMISKDFIVPYPPGIPLVLPGEEITEDVVKAIRWYQGKCISILGIYYNRIKVIKDI
ncbi:Arginine decarboxylase [uncultured Clostridium sp.]|uniref:aminotransferase class I/II-fold pyridoxal phosphate-dependent enzyme n=1 Tax=uncultured Clostridium sp. TaxID=59620 RepID=UPI0008221B1E|nr:aminotransferase class I/II-fold pyridoxal phosphate-dependent enzyme [uncultured Clostridium sp.]SCJ62864.1 Arginine decarboxylase [uncultured Clostridium sp.]